MRIVFALVLVLASTSAFSNISQKLKNGHLAYYGAAFFQNFPNNITKLSLHNILNESHFPSPENYDEIKSECLNNNCYFHTPLSYDEARKSLFGKVYIQNDTKGNYINDVYCNKNFYFKTPDEAIRMNSRVNTEHTWPQSKFSRVFAKSFQVADMHHLFLTDSEANSKRGNYPFGEVNEDEDELEMMDCKISRLGKYHDPVFFPPMAHLGNVARALFYFATRYRMNIAPEQESVLRQWHEQDPVDADERARHEIIAKLQKVRNPFVDYPELVKKITDF